MADRDDRYRLKQELEDKTRELESLRREVRDLRASDAGQLRDELSRSERRIANLLMVATSFLRSANAFANVARETFAEVESANRKGEDLTAAQRQRIVDRTRAAQDSFEQAIEAELERRGEPLAPESADGE